MFDLLFDAAQDASPADAKKGRRPMIANPIPWPTGARCAGAMTWDMDADSAFNW